MTSPGNSPSLNQAAQRSQQDFEFAAGVHAAQQGLVLQPRKRTWRRRPIRGLASAIAAVIALAEIPVQLAGRHYWPAIGVTVMFVLFVKAARRRLLPPRRDRSS
jgi:hypothetical protein